MDQVDTVTTPLEAQRSTGKPFGVVCLKADGRRSEFNRYTSKAEAEAIVRSLAEVGCPAEVVDLEKPDMPANGAQ